MTSPRVFDQPELDQPERARVELEDLWEFEEEYTQIPTSAIEETDDETTETETTGLNFETDITCDYATIGDDDNLEEYQKIPIVLTEPTKPAKTVRILTKREKKHEKARKAAKKITKMAKDEDGPFKTAVKLFADEKGKFKTKEAGRKARAAAETAKDAGIEVEKLASITKSQTKRLTRKGWHFAKAADAKQKEEEDKLFERQIREGLYAYYAKKPWGRQKDEPVVLEVEKTVEEAEEAKGADETEEIAETQEVAQLAQLPTWSET
ncbi:hypothetical protein SEUCBS140593_007302 [Sporothrix eucalyptigena]|uniref:Uncharacterized protein n=1 Tax=Sporothrix eucalyptigena TaxID=1812306 RepID=A0ABP0CCR0_9PEZI